MTFLKLVHGPQRMNPADLGDALTFHICGFTELRARRPLSPVCCDVDFFSYLQSASLVSMVTAAIKPAPVSTAGPATPSTDAAPAPLVSTATPVNKVELCGAVT